MSDSDFLQECKPPWVVFPEIEPQELSRYLKQGVTEAWFDQQWRPFWLELTPEEKREYLEHWKATEAWREAIAFHFEEEEEFDLEADARESAEYLEQWRKAQK